MIAIDLFAGLGGFSEGARQAGVSVAFAANHWPTAVEWHTANHPGTAQRIMKMHTETPAGQGPAERMVRPWKWAVREAGGAGLWAGRDSLDDANATALEWAADGYEPEVVALYDRAALDAAVAAERERGAKLRECLEWLQQRHHGGLMRAKIDEALRA